jgi:hypothetical protein
MSRDIKGIIMDRGERAIQRQGSQGSQDIDDSLMEEGRGEQHCSF